MKAIFTPKTNHWSASPCKTFAARSVEITPTGWRGEEASGDSFDCDAGLWTIDVLPEDAIIIAPKKNNLGKPPFVADSLVETQDAFTGVKRNGDDFHCSKKYWTVERPDVEEPVEVVFEIISGSADDFAVAPDWATECIWTDKSFCYWLDPVGKKYLNLSWSKVVQKWDGMYGHGNYTKAARRIVPKPAEAIRQPIEGLPPAGFVCEVQVGAGAWMEVEVIHHHSGVWLHPTCGSHSDFILANPTPSSFRALRSTEEKAKDAIAELCRSSASNGHSADLIYAAIAAGDIPGVGVTGK